MNQLDPKAVWLFFLQYSIGSIVVFGFFSCFLPFAFFIPETAETFGYSRALPNPILFACLCWTAIILFSVGFAYAWAVLTYNNFRYELHEDGFKVEKGVIFKRYVTIPYERIQNVDIYRGIFARMLDLSDIQVQTAGFSSMGQYGMMFSEGRLPALNKEVAEKLRTDLVRRAKGQKPTDV